jgi:hypothetical protein
MVITPDGHKYHFGYHIKMPSKGDLWESHAEITRRHSHNQNWATLAQPYRHNGSVDWEDDYYNTIRKQEIEAGLDINWKIEQQAKLTEQVPTWGTSAQGKHRIFNNWYKKDDSKELEESLDKVTTDKPIMHNFQLNYSRFKDINKSWLVDPDKSQISTVPGEKSEKPDKFCHWQKLDSRVMDKSDSGLIDTGKFDKTKYIMTSPIESFNGEDTPE